MFRWLSTKPAPVDTGRQALGLSIEARAARWLMEQGLTLLERNYRIVGGEIDLILRHDAQIVFVEVRYRREPGSTRAVDSVGPRKQRLLLRCAQAWLGAHREHARRPCRFDVLGVEGEPEQLRFEWIRDAFGADA